MDTFIGAGISSRYNETMISRLKKLRDALRKRANDLKERQKEAAEDQRRRKRLLKQKRERRGVLRRAMKHYRELYNNLPEDVDEIRAHEVKVKLVDAHKEFIEINKEIDDVVTKSDNVAKAMKDRSRDIYHIVKVRMPHVNKRIKNAQKQAEDAGWSPTGSRLVVIEGKQCAEHIAYRIFMARAAGFRGSLNSLFRSPEYSQQLCYQICGAPSCPGRCAGTSSNHTQYTYPNGAADVGDYYTFGSIMRALASKIPGYVLINRLGAADPVHYSASGY